MSFYLIVTMSASGSDSSSEGDREDVYAAFGNSYEWDETRYSAAMNNRYHKFRSLVGDSPLVREFTVRWNDTTTVTIADIHTMLREVRAILRTWRTTGGTMYESLTYEDCQVLRRFYSILGQANEKLKKTRREQLMFYLTATSRHTTVPELGALPVELGDVLEEFVVGGPAGGRQWLHDQEHGEIIRPGPLSVSETVERDSLMLYLVGAFGPPDGIGELPEEVGSVVDEFIRGGPAGGRTQLYDADI